MGKASQNDYCAECGNFFLRGSAHECDKALPETLAPDPSEGRKDDAGKARYDLLPPELLEAAADILTFGAAKYGERNWERGMKWGRPFAACMRHLWAWWRGEKADKETGKSHLWHACACIAFLIAFEQRGIGTDDRPKTKNGSMLP